MSESGTSPSPGPADERSAAGAVLRGARLTCPACGEGRLYRAYLAVADHCPACRTELLHHRADDAPPYFTIFIVGHIVVAGVLALEQAWQPETWVHLAIWVPLTLALSLALLPRVKGALVGLQWALGMHGFGAGLAALPTPQPHPEPDVSRRGG
jgi:uncharacterized protein (DUF983 family)